MDELYQEYDKSEAITDEAPERIKSAGMQDEYEAIKRHLWSSITLINNLQLAVIRKDNRLNELVNEDNTGEEILRIIQNLENCRKGGSKSRFPKFVGAAIKIIEEWEGSFARKGATIANKAIAKMNTEKVDEKLIPGNPEKVVCNLIKNYTRNK